MFPDCSIIIPAYNADRTIVAALDSLELSKIWKYQIEVIVIDDGSTDNTYELLTDYASKYSCIRVIRQINSGVSSARNNGIISAKGKYIFFMDSDDLLVRKNLDRMIDAANKYACHLVIADYFEFITQSGSKKKQCCKFPYYTQLSKEYSKNIVFPRFFVGDNIGISNLWNKLFLLEKIKENRLLFDTKRFHGEDWEFCIKYFDIIDSYYAIPDVVYVYHLTGDNGIKKHGNYNLYGFVQSYRLQRKMLDKYKFIKLDSNDFIIFIGRFANLIVLYLKEDKINIHEKRMFVRNKCVKEVINMVINLKKEEIQIIRQSRKYKLAFLFFKYRFIKTGLYFV